MSEEEKVKIPPLREIIDFMNSKPVRYSILVIAVIILIVSGFKLAKISQCSQKDGLYMQDGSCYVPRNETERQQIIEQGYRDIGWKWGREFDNIFEGKTLEFEE